MVSEPTPVKGFMWFSLTTGARPGLSRGQRLCLRPLARFLPFATWLGGCGHSSGVDSFAQGPGTGIAGTYWVFPAGLGQSLEGDVGSCIRQSDTGINDCLFCTWLGVVLTRTVTGSWCFDVKMNKNI